MSSPIPAYSDVVSAYVNGQYDVAHTGYVALINQHAATYKDQLKTGSLNLPAYTLAKQDYIRSMLEHIHLLLTIIYTTQRGYPILKAEQFEFYQLFASINAKKCTDPAVVMKNSGLTVKKCYFLIDQYLGLMSTDTNLFINSKDTKDYFIAKGAEEYQSIRQLPEDYKDVFISKTTTFHDLYYILQYLTLVTATTRIYHYMYYIRRLTKVSSTLMSEDYSSAHSSLETPVLPLLEENPDKPLQIPLIDLLLSSSSTNTRLLLTKCRIILEETKHVISPSSGASTGSMLSVSSLSPPSTPFYDIIKGTDITNMNNTIILQQQTQTLHKHLQQLITAVIQSLASPIALIAKVVTTAYVLNTIIAKYTALAEAPKDAETTANFNKSRNELIFTVNIMRHYNYFSELTSNILLLTQYQQNITISDIKESITTHSTKNDSKALLSSIPDPFNMQHNTIITQNITQSINGAMTLALLLQPINTVLLQLHFILYYHFPFLSSSIENNMSHSYASTILIGQDLGVLKPYFGTSKDDINGFYDINFISTSSLSSLKNLTDIDSPTSTNSLLNNNNTITTKSIEQFLLNNSIAIIKYINIVFCNFQTTLQYQQQNSLNNQDMDNFMFDVNNTRIPWILQLLISTTTLSAVKRVKTLRHFKINVNNSPVVTGPDVDTDGRQLPPPIPESVRLMQQQKQALESTRNINFNLEIEMHYLLHYTLTLSQATTISYLPYTTFPSVTALINDKKNNTNEIIYKEKIPQYIEDILYLLKLFTPSISNGSINVYADVQNQLPRLSGLSNDDQVYILSLLSALYGKTSNSNILLSMSYSAFKKILRFKHSESNEEEYITYNQSTVYDLDDISQADLNTLSLLHVTQSTVSRTSTPGSATQQSIVKTTTNDAKLYINVKDFFYNTIQYIFNDMFTTHNTMTAWYDATIYTKFYDLASHSRKKTIINHIDLIYYHFKSIFSTSLYLSILSNAGPLSLINIGGQSTTSHGAKEAAIVSALPLTTITSPTTQQQSLLVVMFDMILTSYNTGLLHHINNDTLQLPYFFEQNIAQYKKFQPINDIDFNATSSEYYKNQSLFSPVNFMLYEILPTPIITTGFDTQDGECDAQDGGNYKKKEHNFDILQFIITFMFTSTVIYSQYIQQMTITGTNPVVGDNEIDDIIYAKNNSLYNPAYTHYHLLTLYINSISKILQLYAINNNSIVYYVLNNMSIPMLIKLSTITTLNQYFTILLQLIVTTITSKQMILFENHQLGQYLAYNQHIYKNNLYDISYKLPIKPIFDAKNKTKQPVNFDQLDEDNGENSDDEAIFDQIYESNDNEEKQYCFSIIKQNNSKNTIVKQLTYNDIFFTQPKPITPTLINHSNTNSKTTAQILFNEHWLFFLIQYFHYALVPIDLLLCDEPIMEDDEEYNAFLKAQQTPNDNEDVIDETPYDNYVQKKSLLDSTKDKKQSGAATASQGQEGNKVTSEDMLVEYNVISPYFDALFSTLTTQCILPQNNRNEVVSYIQSIHLKTRTSKSFLIFKYLQIQLYLQALNLLNYLIKLSPTLGSFIIKTIPHAIKPENNNEAAMVTSSKRYGGDDGLLIEEIDERSTIATTTTLVGKSPPNVIDNSKYKKYFKTKFTHTPPLLSTLLFFATSLSVDTDLTESFIQQQLLGNGSESFLSHQLLNSHENHELDENGNKKQELPADSKPLMNYNQYLLLLLKNMAIHVFAQLTQDVSVKTLVAAHGVDMYSLLATPDEYLITYPQIYPITDKVNNKDLLSPQQQQLLYIVDNINTPTNQHIDNTSNPDTQNDTLISTVNNALLIPRTTLQEIATKQLIQSNILLATTQYAPICTYNSSRHSNVYQNNNNKVNQEANIRTDVFGHMFSKRDMMIKYNPYVPIRYAYTTQFPIASLYSLGVLLASQTQLLSKADGELLMDISSQLLSTLWHQLEYVYYFDQELLYNQLQWLLQHYQYKYQKQQNVNDTNLKTQQQLMALLNSINHQLNPSSSSSGSALSASKEKAVVKYLQQFPHTLFSQTIVTTLLTNIQENFRNIIESLMYLTVDIKIKQASIKHKLFLLLHAFSGCIAFNNPVPTDQQLAQRQQELAEVGQSPPDIKSHHNIVQCKNTVPTIIDLFYEIHTADKTRVSQKPENKVILGDLHYNTVKVINSYLGETLLRDTSIRLALMQILHHFSLSKDDIKRDEEQSQTSEQIAALKVAASRGVKSAAQGRRLKAGEKDSDGKLVKDISDLYGTALEMMPIQLMTTGYIVDCLYQLKSAYQYTFVQGLPPDVRVLVEQNTFKEQIKAGVGSDGNYKMLSAKYSNNLLLPIPVMMMSLQILKTFSALKMANDVLTKRYKLQLVYSYDIVKFLLDMISQSNVLLKEMKRRDDEYQNPVTKAPAAKQTTIFPQHHYFPRKDHTSTTLIDVSTGPTAANSASGSSNSSVMSYDQVKNTTQMTILWATLSLARLCIFVNPHHIDNEYFHKIIPILMDCALGAETTHELSIYECLLAATNLMSKRTERVFNYCVENNIVERCLNTLLIGETTTETNLDITTACIELFANLCGMGVLDHYLCTTIPSLDVFKKSVTTDASATTTISNNGVLLLRLLLNFSTYDEVVDKYVYHKNEDGVTHTAEQRPCSIMRLKCGALGCLAMLAASTPFVAGCIANTTLTYQTPDDVQKQANGKPNEVLAPMALMALYQSPKRSAEHEQGTPDPSNGVVYGYKDIRIRCGHALKYIQQAMVLIQQNKPLSKDQW